MFFKKFISEQRKRFEELVEPVPFDETVDKVEQFVPCTDKFGNLLTVGMQVDFEPINVPFDYFSPEFALKSGNVKPISTYPPSAFRIVEMSNQLNLKSLE